MSWSACFTLLTATLLSFWTEMNINQISKVLDRLESSTVGPWDTMIDTEGRATLTSPNQEVLANNIGVEDAWYVSHSREDIKLLINEVLDFRRLVHDIHLMLEDRHAHGNIMAYIEGFMRERIG